MEYYLREATKDESTIGLLAVQALKRLLATKENEVVRKFAPSLREMNIIKVS